MAGLDRKRRGELLRSVFDVLADHPEGIRARDALGEVEKRLGMTEFEAANYPNSDVRRFEKSIRFVTINAVKAGWMVKEAGVWSPTEDGLQAHAKIADPVQFLAQAQELYRAWEKAQPPQQEDEQLNEEEEEEFSATSVTLERAEEASWEEVREVLDQMDPYDFQQLVAGLLRGMGYHVTWISPRGKDQGVDIVALSDPIGTRGPRLKVQVKREQKKTSATTLRAFYSVLHEGDVGVFITLGGFSSDAVTEARNEARRIRLIDATEFFRLWARHYDDIPEEDRRRLPISFVPFLVPARRDR
ncbi:MAG TPA: restriction endonuclease [Solirubrobacterales bacterium]|jgi:restriction system protein